MHEINCEYRNMNTFYCKYLNKCILKTEKCSYNKNSLQNIYGVNEFI